MTDNRSDDAVILETEGLENTLRQLKSKADTLFKDYINTIKEIENVITRQMYLVGYIKGREEYRETMENNKDEESKPIQRCHVIKVWPPYFQQTVDGDKTWELRVNDRDYKIGDVLMMKEWIPEIGEYTGRIINATITYMVESNKDEKFFALPPGMCIMTIKINSVEGGKD